MSQFRKTGKGHPFARRRFFDSSIEQMNKSLKPASWAKRLVLRIPPRVLAATITQSPLSLSGAVNTAPCVDSSEVSVKGSRAESE